jgi:hypothetical protein
MNADKRYYLDTSALLPYYREESASQGVQEILLSLKPPIFISDLTRVEFASAIAIRRKNGYPDEKPLFEPLMLFIWLVVGVWKQKSSHVMQCYNNRLYFLGSAFGHANEFFLIRNFWLKARPFRV